MTNITIHHSAPAQRDTKSFYEELDKYLKRKDRNRKIIECLMCIIFITTVIFRAYIFLKFGY